MDDAEVQRTIEDLEQTTREINEQIQQSSLNEEGVGTILPPSLSEEEESPQDGDTD